MKRWTGLHSAKLIMANRCAGGCVSQVDGGNAGVSEGQAGVVPGKEKRQTWD